MLRAIRIPALLLTAAICVPSQAEQTTSASHQEADAAAQTTQTPASPPAGQAPSTGAASAVPQASGAASAEPASGAPAKSEAASAEPASGAPAESEATAAPAQQDAPQAGVVTEQGESAPAQAPSATAEAPAPSPQAEAPAEVYTPPLPPEYERILRQLAEWQDYVKKQHETRKQWAEQRMERLRKEREEAVKRAIEEQEKLAKYYEAMRRLAEEQKAWIEKHRDEYLKQAEEREKGLLEYHEQMRRMAEERQKQLTDKLAHIDRLTRQEVQDLVEEMRRQMHEDALALDSSSKAEPAGPSGQMGRMPMPSGYGPSGAPMRRALPQGGWRGTPVTRQPAWAGPQTSYPRTGGWEMTPPPTGNRGGWSAPMGVGQQAVPPAGWNWQPPGERPQMQPSLQQPPYGPPAGQGGGGGYPQGYQPPMGMPAYPAMPGPMGPQSRMMRPHRHPRLAAMWWTHHPVVPPARAYPARTMVVARGPAWRPAPAWRGAPVRFAARWPTRTPRPAPVGTSHATPRLVLRQSGERRPG